MFSIIALTVAWLAAAGVLAISTIGPKPKQLTK
jgi:hypothetical protein